MWYYKDKEVTEIDPKFVAFVYRIENLTNGKKYIGKKRLQFIRTKTIKGKKKKVKSESDWRSYHGSYKELLEDIEKLGEENFKHEILDFCTTLGQSSYLEAKYQFLFEVLERDDFYNSSIMVRVHRSHLPKKPLDNPVP